MEEHNNDQDSDVNTEQEPDETIGEQTEVNRRSSELSSSPTSQLPEKPKRPKKKVIIAVLVFVLLAASAIGWHITRPKKATNQQATPKTESTPAPVTEKPISKTEEDQLLQKFLNPTTGETWLAVPKKLTDQGYLKDGDPNSTEYYEVGKHGDKTIIMSVVSMLGDDIRLYEKAKDGKVVFIARPDADAVYNEDNEKYYTDSFVSTVSIDKSLHYDSLTIPRKLDLDKGYVLTKPAYPSLGDYIRPPAEGLTKPPKDTEVKKVGQSTIVRKETIYSDVKLTSMGYVLKTPVNTVIHLGYEPLETELKNYEWQRGNSSTDTLRAISRGCGAFFTSISRADAVTDTDVKEVGKSPSGLSVYEFASINHPLLQKAYEEFSEFTKDSPNTPFAGISKAEFISNHGVVLYKDKFGQWLIYARDQLRPGYGCAKPVVYLYPEVTQQVRVRIGADVKVSDPFYDPKTGWNVVAHPNGSIDLNSKTYESLFWEGPGVGDYPSITTGTVVSKQQALPVIRQQLEQLGLTSKEIDDFVAYWQDKLPNKPYIRLTWITTAEMNRLAPLYITPKPDTVIRVFLDFAGFDAPIQIPAQTLTSIPREGFTVVEWGGLAGHKLY